MNRRHFLHSLAASPLLMHPLSLQDVSAFTSQGDKMPVLFIGHGNPMYAITDNPYRKVWQELGKKLPQPKAVLCISAHWLTNNTSITMTEKPKTIHDFGGFPQELFDVKYPAPGSPTFGRITKNLIQSTQVQEDMEWGLDHGAWSVLRNMYPEANIPIFQMSRHFQKSAYYHYQLAKEIMKLRYQGVLILASGNVVHNLGMMNWDEQAKPFDWAIEFDELVRDSIQNNNPTPLIEYEKMGNVAKLAHPTNDHYLPLMYALGVRDQKDEVTFFNDTLDMGSLSMRSVLFS